MFLTTGTMVATSSKGQGMSAQLQLAGDEKAAYVQALASRGATVERMFDRLMVAMDAETTARSGTGVPGVYEYITVPDHVARIGAINLMAKLLRMLPETSSAKVSVAVDARTIEISASEVVSEALSVGISEDEVLAQIEANVAEVRAARAKGLAKGEGTQAKAS